MYFNISSNFFSSTTDDNSHFAGCIFFSIAVFIHVVFIARFKYATFRNCAFFHYIFALWIGCALLVWFAIALSPVYHAITENCYNASTFDEDNTTAKEAVETISTFLKPFYIEFVTICLGVFLNLWNKFDDSYENHASVRHLASSQIAESGHDVNRRSIEEDTLEIERHCDTEASNDTISSRMIFIIPLLASLFYVFVFVIGHYLNENYEGLPVIYVGNGIRVLFHLLLLIFFIPISRAMTKYKLHLKLTSLTCSETVLIGTHTVHYVYSFFRFFATILLLISHESNHLTNTELVFTMIFAGVCMIDIWCATYYILAMKSLQRAGRKMTKFDKFGLVYNAGIHLAEWAVTGLDHEWALLSATQSLVPALTATFGDATIRVVTLVVYPIMEFYRFHAAVVCFEIAKNM